MATLNEVFTCFFLSCKANARVKTRKDGARPALFLIFVLFYVLFVLCRSLYCLFVYMCTALLPPGGYPTAINPLKPELNPICYLLALLGAHHFLHVSRIRVKLLTFRRLMSYIYGAPILDVSRSHTTTQHSR